MALLLFGLLIAFITVALSIGGLLISRRLTNQETRNENSMVADPLLQVIGTLYAVLLGLLVVQAMERFEEARLNVESEAVALADTFRLATVLPTDLRTNLQRECLIYARSVVEEEWDDMQREEVCDQAWEAIDKMWWEVISFAPKTDQEKYVYPQLLDSAQQLNDYRRTRLVTSRSWVSPILWVVLITGAMSVVGFTYSFGVQNLGSQIFMTSMVAITLSLNLYLWSIYSNPFYGLLRVNPEAFQMDIEHFEFYLEHPDTMRWNRYLRKGVKSAKPAAPSGKTGDELPALPDRSDEGGAEQGPGESQVTENGGADSGEAEAHHEHDIHEIGPAEYPGARKAGKGERHGDSNTDKAVRSSRTIKRKEPQAPSITKDL